MSNDIRTRKKKTILFFGDSITQAGVKEQGYITQLQGIIDGNEMTDRAELIGKGIGGNKVYDLYLRMQDDCIAHDPDIVVIYIGVMMFGTNRVTGQGQMRTSL